MIVANASTINDESQLLCVCSCVRAPDAANAFCFGLHVSLFRLTSEPQFAERTRLNDPSLAATVKNHVETKEHEVASSSRDVPYLVVISYNEAATGPFISPIVRRVEL